MNADPKPRLDQILDAAEARMRKGGFSAASFRDLANDVGVKSASVHYHFPAKADLGAALVARYADGFLDVLGPADYATPRDAISALVSAYRDALRAQNAACLCTILGAESQTLPDPVAKAVTAFYARLLAWGTSATGDEELAEYSVSALQGAMVLAIARNNMAAFDRVAARLLRSI